MRPARHAGRIMLLSKSQHLEQAGCAHAAADAHGDDDMLHAKPLTGEQRVADEALPGHAERVTDRDRAAIDIEPVVGDAEPIAAVDHLHREGFVELPETDVLDLETGARQ